MPLLVNSGDAPSAGLRPAWVWLAAWLTLAALQTLHVALIPQPARALPEPLQGPLDSVWMRVFLRGIAAAAAASLGLLALEV